MPPNLPGECIKCRKRCKAWRHYCEACHKQKYLCQLPKCNEPHYSGGRCKEHAVKHEGTQPTSGIVFHKHGAPEGIAERREWLARRMEILGAEIGAELRDIGRIARWEQERNSDVEE